MADEAENIIRFHAPPENFGDPQPYRAVRAIPEWLKEMPPQMEVPGFGPVSMLKLCAPFVEAMGCGYIIPLRGGVKFTMHGSDRLEIDNLEFSKSGGVATEQPGVQYRGTPFGGMFAVKFVNYWIVQTPPGYSCLFLPVLNQFIMPFQVLAGVIETDTYYRGVNFPAICLMQPNSQVMLEKGTPLVQVIPFKRETWRAECAVWDAQRQAQVENSIAGKPNHYKEMNWVKKEFR